MSLNTLREKAKEFSLPQENIEKRENGRLSFISKFPLVSIKDLDIDQYVQGTDENSFCYWLEFNNILSSIRKNITHITSENTIYSIEDIIA